MKKKIYKLCCITLLGVFTLPVVGQNIADSVIIQDGWNTKGATTITTTDEFQGREPKKVVQEIKYVTTTTAEQTKVELTIFGENVYKRSRENRSKHKFSGHWSGLYAGFTNYMQDGKIYNPDDGLMRLDWSDSQTLIINPFQVSIGISRNNKFGVVLGAGIEYQRLRFADDHKSIVKGDDGVIKSAGINEDFSVRRSTLKHLYLTIPVIFEVQAGQFYLSAGVVGAVRMHSKTKVVYDYDGDKDKLKNTSDFSMIPFKLDASVRVGYRSVAIFSNYTLTQMFESNKGPKLQPLTIGFGFNW